MAPGLRRCRQPWNPQNNLNFGGNHPDHCTCQCLPRPRGTNAWATHPRRACTQITGPARSSDSESEPGDSNLTVLRFGLARNSDYHRLGVSRAVRRRGRANAELASCPRAQCPTNQVELETNPTVTAPEPVPSITDTQISCDNLTGIMIGALAILKLGLAKRQESEPGPGPSPRHDGCLWHTRRQRLD